jgi:hypothetical protein
LYKRKSSETLDIYKTYDKLFLQLRTKHNKKQIKTMRKQSSLKGKWGHIGAPPKKTRWPNKPFTMATLFERNPHQCELSLRNKVEAELKAKNLVALQPKKQANHAVGRPKSVFVLKANYNAKKMTALGAVKATKVRVKRTKTVDVAPAIAATAPINPATPTAAPVTAAPVESTAPAAPAPVEPVVESAAPAPTVLP